MTELPPPTAPVPEPPRARQWWNRPGPVIAAVVAAVAVVGIFVAIGLASERDDLDDLAAETCADIDGEPLLLVAVILDDAVDEAERLGFDSIELGDAMRDECPGLMDALSDFGN